MIQAKFKSCSDTGNGVRVAHFEGGRSSKIEVLMLSDLHWDNPDCDRKLLKKHLDLALENKWRIVINGDLFCLMQGKYDPRSSKSKVRPEHQVDSYLDAVIDTAVDWFEPYAHLIDIIGYGNHETAIMKRQETDVIKRFVHKLNAQAKSNVGIGGYGGWYVLANSIHQVRTNYKIKYYHGSGGGGVVTKGMINLTRAFEMYDGFDCFTMGHVHEQVSNHRVLETLNHHNNIVQREAIACITGTYKDEYKDGTKGWHIERGMPAKPKGGTLLTVEFRLQNGKQMQKHAYTTRMSPF